MGLCFNFGLAEKRMYSFFSKQADKTLSENETEGT